MVAMYGRWQWWAGLVSCCLVAAVQVTARPSLQSTRWDLGPTAAFHIQDEGWASELTRSGFDGQDAPSLMDEALVENCGGEGDILQLEDLFIDPLPPQRGENLTIKATGTLSETLEQGSYITLAVRYGVLRLISKRLDLCEQSEAQVNVSCPIAQGRQTVERTVALPKQIPKGRYTVDGRAYTADNRDIACLHGVVTFR